MGTATVDKRLPTIAVWLAIALLAGECFPHSARAAARSPGGPPVEIMSGDLCVVVFTLFVDLKTVASWLPSGFVLAEECPFPQHPVIVLYGTQENLMRQRRIAWALCWGRNYLETFVAVPYLKLAQCPERPPVLHFVRVYLNNWPATIKGMRRFGWPKLCTHMESCACGYRIFSGCGEKIFDARAGHSEAEPLRGKNESFSQIRQMLSQPMVLKRDACFEAHAFDLHWDEACVLSVRTHVQMREGFMPGLPATEISVAGINEGDYGAFHLNTRFTSVIVPY